MDRKVALLVLLLVGDIPFNVEAQRLYNCSSYPDEPCGDGWSRIDDERCVKYFRSPITFPEAQEHCRSLNADLVSVHNEDQMAKLRCLTSRADPRGSQGFWVGAKRSKVENSGFLQSKFTFTDGSEFELDKCCYYEPSNSRGRVGCIRLKLKVRASCKVVRCFKMKPFVCAKNMSGSSLADQDQSWGSTPVSANRMCPGPLQEFGSPGTPASVLPFPTSVPPTGASGGKREQRRHGVGLTQPNQTSSSPHL